MSCFRNSIKAHEARIGFILCLPALGVFLLIVVYPFVNSTIMSFTNRSLIYKDADFVGFENYIEILLDSGFSGIIKNTVFFLVASTLLPFVGGLIWAILLDCKFKGAEFLRGITLVNWIIPSTSVAFLWMWIFHGEYGILNALLKGLGIIQKNINWLGEVNTAMSVVIIARTWQLLPWNMAFLTGGLHGISMDVIEASRIDGANNFKTFTHIILPDMKEIIVIVLLMSAISNLQHFDLFWVMTQGGPARSTLTLALETYRTGFKNFDMGMAAAVGVIWAIVLTIVAIFYLKAMNRSERG